MLVTLPNGLAESVLAVDRGFGYGYDISFRTSDTLLKTSTKTSVKIRGYAPEIDTTLQVLVEFGPL